MNGEDRVVIVGSPGGRRETLFRAAVTGRGMDPPELVSWIDVLRRPGLLRERVARARLLRIETPGEDPRTYHRLLRLGLEEAVREGSSAASERTLEDLPDDPSCVIEPRVWYLGLREACKRMAREIDGFPALTLMNSLEEIPTLFDKEACQQLAASAGVRIPSPLGRIRHYDELRERASESGLSRLFLKPAHGSSGAGIVAIEWHPRGVRGLTNVAEVTRHPLLMFRSSLKLRVFRSEVDVADLVDQLAPARLFAEEWLPKVQIGGRNTDFRVLVVGGRARHALGRANGSPITNLNLGGERIAEEVLRSELGSLWDQIVETAERVPEIFPRSLHLGVDLLVPSRSSKPRLLEVNAFGDLLPGLLDRGETTYEAELSHLLGAVAC